MLLHVCAEINFKESIIRYGSRQCGALSNAINLILRLFLYHFFTYVELVTAQVHPQQHKHTMNITTMVVELLAPPAAWI